MGLARKSAPNVDAYKDNDEDAATTTEDPHAGLSAENDDEPTTRSSSVPKRGWGAAKKAVAESGDFGNEFKWPEDEALIKFPESEPFATAHEHWVDEITSGKRSFYCLGDIGPKKDCPLCKAGNTAK